MLTLAHKVVLVWSYLLVHVIRIGRLLWLLRLLVEAIVLCLRSCLGLLHLQLILEVLLADSLRLRSMELVILHLLGSVLVLFCIYHRCFFHQLKFLLILDVFH